MAADHRYTSTACHHRRHARCRRVCKFCGAPCVCPCHEGAASIAVKLVDGTWAAWTGNRPVGARGVD